MEEEELRTRLLKRFQSKSLGKFREAKGDAEPGSTPSERSIAPQLSDQRKRPHRALESGSGERDQSSSSSNLLQSTLPTNMKRSRPRSTRPISTHHAPSTMSGSASLMGASTIPSIKGGGAGQISTSQSSRALAEHPLPQTPQTRGNGKHEAAGAPFESPSGMDLQRLIEARIRGETIPQAMHTAPTEPASKPLRQQQPEHQISPPEVKDEYIEMDCGSDVPGRPLAAPLDGEPYIPYGEGSCMCDHHRPGYIPCVTGPQLALTDAIRQAGVRWRKEYKREAKEGDATAIGLMGQMYLVGFGGLRRDVKRAFRWLKSAARKGNSTAISLLVQLRSQGITPKTNPSDLQFRLQNFTVTGRVQDNGTLLPQLQVPFDTFEGSTTQISRGNLLQYVPESSDAKPNSHNDQA